MGDHTGKPSEKEKIFKPLTPTKEQSDGRPDDGKHEKPSSK